MTVNLSIGRGEKRPASEGAGLTIKGRKKYNARTGSKLKPPVKAGNKSKAAQGRRKSFCARSRGWKGERGKAARRNWDC
jgi:hypothetical protein